MKRIISGFLLGMLVLFGRSDATAQDRPNVLLLCIDDLRPELACFGKAYISSPNIDALAESGFLFHRHYVQAPTCGASRYALLVGRYGPSGNGALFQRATQLSRGGTGVPVTMPGHFRQHGYATVSIGKVSHHPGGRGGPNWDDQDQPELPGAWTKHLMPTGSWKHPRGAMHGLAHGQIRGNASQMDVYESAPGGDAIYPDGLTTETALNELRSLVQNDDEQPFFLAVGIIRPHLPFGAPAKYMEPYEDTTLPAIPHPEKPEGRTTWHRSGEFMKYNRWNRNPNQDAEFATLVRKHYAACVSYADAQVGRILTELKTLHADENTIVVLWGDHGWHLGEHAIWGKHALFEESLRSPLVIYDPRLEQNGESVRERTEIVETIDIFPTLCDLAGLPSPSGLHGESLRPLIISSGLAQRGANSTQALIGTAVSYAGPTTIRTNRFRLIEHKDGFVELYDHDSPDGETVNVAAKNPAAVKSLQKLLHERLKDR